MSGPLPCRAVRGRGRAARGTSAGSPGCRRRTPTPRAPRRDAGPRRRSTGSRTGPPGRSRQGLLGGARRPDREPLAVLALGLETLQDPLDVVRQFVGGDLQSAHLAAEGRLQAEGAAEVHLVAADLAALVVRDELALEADVGGLDARAGVRAAVDVDGERLVEVRQAALEFVDELAAALLGLHDGQLAELDAGAGHGAAPEGRAGDPQIERLEAAA